MDIRTLHLAKAGHAYVLAYTPGREDEVIEEVMRLADDRSVSFDWQDAAIWGRKVTQLAAENHRRGGLTQARPRQKM